MNKEMEVEKILQFQKQYQTENNIQIEKEIRKKGIHSACLNSNLNEKYSYQFNLEIPEIKIYNQHKSYQCNIYAFFRVVKSIMQKEQPALSIDDLDLSANYIDFYDKFEKINVVYNALLEEENITLSTISELVNRYVGIYGTFHFCRELVKKYGFVPTKAMSEANEKQDAFLNLELLKAKIKTDATLLIGKSKEQKQKEKEKLMQEAYNFLSKTMGNPPTKFIFQNEEYTPLTFKEKYLPTNLEDFITITSYDKNTFLESFSFIPNIYLNKKENIKVMSTQQIKEVVRKQLEDGIAVWFSAEESTTLDYEQNILDTNTYKYKELLNIKELPKKQQLLLDIINYDHAMCITGAFIVDNEIKQWKVDNSFGKHGAYQGHLIMTNDFFENYIITLIVNKNYL